MFHAVTFIQFTDLAEALCADSDVVVCAPFEVGETSRRVSRVAAGRGCNDVANAAASSGAADLIIRAMEAGQTG